MGLLVSKLPIHLRVALKYLALVLVSLARIHTALKTQLLRHIFHSWAFSLPVHPRSRTPTPPLIA